MPIIVVGVNQHTASVAVREQLAVSPEAVPGALAAVRTRAAEGFLLSTCNRVEAYAVVEEAAAGAAHLQRVLAARSRLSPSLLGSYGYVHTDTAAVRHLFAVAAGLDSLIVGEDQILAQIKAALETSRAADALGPVLDRLGQRALTAGKQVRSATAISRRHLSVVSVALRLATQQVGDLREQRVLIVGGGQTAELALKHLSRRPPALLTVINRTAARAVALAARYRAEAQPWLALESAVAEADVVVSCTRSSEPVLSSGMVARAVAHRPHHRLLLLDLAVPRDVDPACAVVPGVTLYDLDRLQTISADNRQQRAAEIVRAEVIISEAVEQFLAWWRTRAVVPAIVSLRAQAQAIRDAEVARTLARLPDLTPAETAAVRYLAAALVNKLLHTPMTALKSAPNAAELIVAAQQLFGLTKLPSAAAPAGDETHPDPGPNPSIPVPSNGWAELTPPI
jgi:glutamyl-tRNA reductase